MNTKLLFQFGLPLSSKIFCEALFKMKNACRKIIQCNEKSRKKNLGNLSIRKFQHSHMNSKCFSQNSCFESEFSKNFRDFTLVGGFHCVNYKCTPAVIN